MARFSAETAQPAYNRGLADRPPSSATWPKFSVSRWSEGGVPCGEEMSRRGFLRLASGSCAAAGATGGRTGGDSVLGQREVATGGENREGGWYTRERIATAQRDTVRMGGGERDQAVAACEPWLRLAPGGTVAAGAQSDAAADDGCGDDARSGVGPVSRTGCPACGADAVPRRVLGAALPGRLPGLRRVVSPERLRGPAVDRRP